MIKLGVHLDIFEEDGQYVGLCQELGVSSFGDTPDEAEAATREAVTLFIEECQNMGTLEQVLAESGFYQDGDTWIARKPVAEKELELAV
ncbi:MAG: type II toxin-antitoxin system HicB family antitoxin [Nitrospirae bacterium]|nr:type II toxin-antitoxin system HicB family antitoxin [Nitrospirota bacterium]